MSESTSELPDIFLKDNKKQADIIVANPPYIALNDENVQESVQKFEPSVALFGGHDGFEFIRSWSKKAAELLKPGGLYCFEIGCDQADEAKAFLEMLGQFRDIKCDQDYSGLDRIISCIRK